MRQRKPLIKRNIQSAEEKKNQERAFFNLEGKEWLKRQVNILGRGHNLLNKMSVRNRDVKLKALELTRNRDALTGAKNIINFARRTKFLEVSNTIAARFYGKQTAIDIVGGKPIPTFRGVKTGLLGCQTICATTMALLRSAVPKTGKIHEVRAIRTLAPCGFTENGKIVGMPHTIVSFRINGEQYLADPFKNGYSFIGSKKVGKPGNTLIQAKEAKEVISQLKKQGNWKVALDPADHGINTLEKYAAEAKKYGGQIAREMDLEKFIRELNI